MEINISPEFNNIEVTVLPEYVNIEISASVIANDIAAANAIRAEEAATASEASATVSTTQAGIATEKASEADQSATTATTAAGAAVTAQTASETARDISIANANQTALDRIATGEDRVATGADRVATGEDREATGMDVIATGEDRTATGLDRIATGEDRTQTGLDRAQTGLDRTATEQAKGIAVTKASEANTSAINSQASFTNTQSLLLNFFDPEIIALNLRGIAEGASFEIKLRHVQDDLDLLNQYGFSLVTIPSVTKAGKLYSVLPENGSGDFTVSRNGTKTVMGKNGFLKTVPANVPALEFNVDGTFKGVLVEPSATNLVTNNNSVSISLGSNQILESVIPNLFGTGINGYQIKSNSSSNGGAFSLNIYGAQNRETGKYRCRIYIKKISYPIFYFLYGGKFARFNLETKEVSSGNTATSIIIQEISNNSFFVEIEVDVTVSNIYWVSVHPCVNIDSSSSVNESYIIGLGQITFNQEIGTPIITTSGAVTRPADVITKTNAQDLIGQTEGSVYCEVDYNKLVTGDKFITQISDGTSNNGIWFLINPSNNFVISVRILSGTGFSFSVNQSQFPLGKYKIILNYKSGNTSFFINGVKIDSSINNFNFPVLNRINLGNLNQSGAIYNNHIKTFALSKTAITDAQAIALTTL